ncbi:MAG TPA: hypothetical protein PLC80_12700 [Draconibacterium sp.]|nr:hypothetical protein [Draconibacterium sp.]
MKTKHFFTGLVLILFFSGCVVYSFYPLYTEKDLFTNDLLTGNWTDKDSTNWSFEHAKTGSRENQKTDSTSYVLIVNDKDNRESKFSVHIIKLGGHYFLDFYLEDFYDNQNLDLASFHIVPVHTFAKVVISKNQLQINWFDQNWLEKLIKENKIRIRHEYNGDYILLTASAKDLQKFVTKYVDSEEAFKDGIEAVLNRK